MNRAELVSQIAELTGQPKVVVSGTVTAVIHYVTASLARGEKTTLIGFGTFERRNRQARTGRNPRTLAPLRIPASKVPAFRAGQELKEVVDGRCRQQPWTAYDKSRKATKKTGKAKRR